MKKLNLLVLCLIAFTFQPIFAQSGNSFDNAIPYTFGENISKQVVNSGEEFYYYFEIPQYGLYSFEITSKQEFAFIRYNENKERISSGQINEKMQPGKYFVMTRAYWGGKDLSAGTDYGFRITLKENQVEWVAGEPGGNSFETAGTVRIDSGGGRATAETQGEVLYYKFEVAESGVYRIVRLENGSFYHNGYNDGKPLLVELFDGDRTEITKGEIRFAREIKIELEPGTYYIRTSAQEIPVGDLYGFNISSQEKRTLSVPGMNIMNRIMNGVAYRSHALIGFVVAGILGLGLLLAFFFIYRSIMSEKYNYNPFGLPFILMIGLLIFTAFVPPEALKANETVHFLAIIGSIALGLILMSLILGIKSKKIIAVIVNMVVMLVYLYLLFILFIYAILAIVIIIAFTVGMLLLGATQRGSSGGRGTHCRSCGTALGTSTYCPNCGGNHSF